MINATHDVSLSSWVTSANDPTSPFPIQNLPFGVFRRTGSDEAFRVGVAIGDQVLDLTALKATGMFDSAALDACQASTLNAFMALGPDAWSGLRHILSDMLGAGSDQQPLVAPCLVPQADVEHTVPMQIGDYTDFYASIDHATNIGKLFRPDNPLLPNYEWVPIGYHGRSSSVVISGEDFHRPVGQLKAPDAESPEVHACRRLDYEMEVGIVIGAGNPLGQPVPIGEAEEHVFGLCLLNDWSARDVQAWEYQPLGPFLAKSFATTLSPWIVTMEALAPFRARFSRVKDRPDPLPYLSSAANSETGGVDIRLEVFLQTQQMRKAGLEPHRLSSANFDTSYWTIAQMVTHHTMNGCNLQSGDLFGSGTMSGSVEGSQGALIEITKGGQVPISLPGGETRTFLEDGDRVVMHGTCEREGFASIGFGEAVGTVLAARN